LTPSTTHGGHPRSRGARVATTELDLLFEFGDPLLALGQPASG
jgi:hypothetical protein